MSESVKAPETKAPAKKTQAVTEAKTEAVLYVGPTISGIAITGTRQSRRQRKQPKRMHQ